VTWTVLNVTIQTVAGFLGAHAAATAAHEHKFGFVGHSLAGVIAGALSGYFLQLQAITMVTGTGSLNTLSSADIIVTQVLCGATAGGIAMFAIGIAKNN